MTENQNVPVVQAVVPVEIPVWLFPVRGANDSAAQEVNEIDEKLGKLRVTVPAVKLSRSLPDLPVEFQTPEIARKLKALLSGVTNLNNLFSSIAAEIDGANVEEIVALEAQRAIARKTYVDTRNLIAKTSPALAADLTKIAGSVNQEAPASQKVRDVKVEVSDSESVGTFDTMSAAANKIGCEPASLTGAYITHAGCARWQDAPKSVQFTITHESNDYSVTVTRTK